MPLALHFLERFNGAMGKRMARFARGQDDRKVDPPAPAPRLSAAPTFNDDVSDFRDLDATLWRLAEKVSMRLKQPPNIMGEQQALEYVGT